jgi:hypothetical protein
MAAGAIAAPAAAQYYPPQPYPQQYPQTYPPGAYPQPQYGYGNQSGIGGIIDQLLGNRYNVNDRSAVSRCATAAVQQAQARYTPNGYNQGYNGQGYNGQGYPGQGYNQGYAYNQRGYGIRVTAITNVERRSNGLRVRGLLDTGRGNAYGNRGYGNQGYASGDLSFRCNVDYRGYVSNVKIERNTGYRGY